MLDKTTTEALDDIVFSDEELEVFRAARLAGDGLRRGFDAWVAIGHATEIARRHADMPGGTQRVRGARFRAILDREGLAGGILFCELEPMPTTRCSPTNHEDSTPPRTMSAVDAQVIRDAVYHQMCAELRDAWKKQDN
jgi:hypothetical protein